ncbi:MAG TPA: VanZ family protein [Arenibacter sp.]|nr:VanZ family protein [Arenibacter sp.]
MLSLISFKGNDILPSLNIPHMDKLVHMGFYFGTSVLGILFIRERKRGMVPLQKTMLWTVVFAILYGIIIEVLQSVFTLDRSGDILDVLANSSGAILGCFLMKFVFSGKSPLKWGR